MMKLYRLTERWGTDADHEYHTYLAFAENKKELHLGDHDTAQEINLGDVSSKELAEKLDNDAESENRHHLDGAYSELREFILAACQQHIILNEPDKSSNILAAELIAKQVLWEIAKVGAWL